MRRDPLRTLARLRDIDVLDARRSLAAAQAEAARREAAAAAAEAVLHAEDPRDAPATYGAFLAVSMARRQAAAAALARAEAGLEAGRSALAEARRAEKVLALLRERRAAAERRAALNRDRIRLEDTPIRA